MFTNKKDHGLGWQRWFAWHPVKLCSYDQPTVWLTTVSRLWFEPDQEWIYDDKHLSDPPQRVDNSLAGAMDRCRSGR